MTLGDTTVKTPYDDGLLDYDPDYGYQVAKYWSDNMGKWTPPYKEIASNNWILGLRDYMVVVKNESVIIPQHLEPFRHILAWRTGVRRVDPRYFIEPCLLTGASYEVIAADLGGDRISPKLIEAYSKLCFDVREEDGRMSQSCYLRWRNAVPAEGVINERTPVEQIWRFFGNYFGYTGVVRAFGISHPHGVVEDDAFIQDEAHRLAQFYMIENIARRQVNNFDLNTSVGQHIDYKKYQFETGQDKSQGRTTELLNTFMDIFGTAFRPERYVELAGVVDQSPKEVAVIKSKLLASKNVTSQAIKDEGKKVGVAAVQKHVSERLKTGLPE